MGKIASPDLHLQKAGLILDHRLKRQGLDRPCVSPIFGFQERAWVLWVLRVPRPRLTEMTFDQRGASASSLPTPLFDTRCSLWLRSGGLFIAINFLISSAFPIMDNNRKAVLGL